MMDPNEVKRDAVQWLDARFADPDKYTSRAKVDWVYRMAYEAGMETARKQLRLQLGLGVPQDHLP